ncbi:outer membrane beta-barrel protein [Aquimarina sediminis]|uniref:outer membrane beta-barrel protein n=1 Tax=Aquimarina sediminis TaxID=2070536 RepID=UPI000CA04381|nr:outer membrane beta-barrel protein [Aquimarina sediminis]
MNKNLKVIIAGLCFIVTCITTQAQSIKSISGNVVNSNNTAVFGNALLLSSRDSTMITGTSFLEGKFELLNLNHKKVILKLTSLEFQDTYVDVEYSNEENVELGDIVVSEAQNELEEILVVSKASLVKERADGSLEVKVANTNLATSISVNEILSKSPGVLVDQASGINVFGKGNAIVFINGMRVANERLSALSPSTVEKIEIITNPGPRYDAEGNAVINVVTKRNIDEGSKGVIKNYFSYSDFAGNNNRTNVSYSYKKEKWSISSNYGLLIGDDRWLKKTTRTRNVTGDFFKSDIELDWLYENENFSNYSLGVQYDLDKNSYISLEYNGAYEDMGGNQLSNNIITDTNVSTYNSTLKIDDLDLKNIINVNYYSKLDTLGSNLFIGSQYGSYNNEFDNDINESRTVNNVQSNSLINNKGEGKIKIVSAQLDYTKAFKNGTSIEAGGKFGYVNNKSFTNFFDVQNTGEAIRDEDLSSNFEYNERVPAGYVNLKGKINDKINYSIGTRVELTDYELFTDVDGGVTVEDKYVNVFPNASFTTKLSDETNIYFTYSSRISRPSYESLNPFVIYQDEFTSIRGNSDLQPAKIHAFEIGGSYNKWSLKIGYTYTNDRISRAAFQSDEDPREYVLQSLNFDKEHSYFASLTKNLNLKWWRSTNTMSVSYNDLIDDTNVFQVRDNIFNYYFYSQNSFDLKSWATIYLTGWYLSDLQDGIYLRKNQGAVNIGVEKKMFNNAIKCNLDFNDVFHSIRADGDYKSGSTDIVYENTFNTNYIRFSVSYNFGRLKKSGYKNKDVGKSEGRRAQ